MASETVRVRITGQTDVGLVREHNEDSFLIVDLDRGCTRPSLLRNYELGAQGALLLVCDGMGGAAAGEVASSMAVQGMRRALLREVGLDPDMVEPPDPDQSALTRPPQVVVAAGATAPVSATEITAELTVPSVIIADAGDAPAEPVVASPEPAAPAEPAAPLEPPPAAAAADAPDGAASAPASEEVVTTEMTNETLPRQARGLRDAVYNVNLEIFEAACADMAKAGMGTTLTAVWLRRNRVVVAQVGDSRAYMWRAGKLVQITHDQSLVNQLLDSGQITPEQAKLFEHSNVILQALGVQEDVEVLVSMEELRQGDRVLVCSDGLVGVVSDEEIQEVMGISDSLADTAQTLIDMARAAGGPDNITVILAQVDGDLPPPGPDEEVRYRQLALDPPQRAQRTQDEMDLSAERFGAMISGPPYVPPPLSLWAVLSMAWVLGLLVAGVVVGVLLYPQFVPAHPPLRGAQCYFKADRAGLDILLDGQARYRTEAPGVLVALAPGQYRVALRDAAAEPMLVSTELSLVVTPGQRCAVRLPAPSQPLMPAAPPPLPLPPPPPETDREHAGAAALIDRVVEEPPANLPALVEKPLVAETPPAAVPGKDHHRNAARRDRRPKPEAPAAPPAETAPAEVAQPETPEPKTEPAKPPEETKAETKAEPAKPPEETKTETKPEPKAEPAKEPVKDKDPPPEQKAAP